MPWEMLSGPDLGAGFLFQLTVERLGERARLIYHAQEGGIDASGPPKGSPAPFGFTVAEGACGIGGGGCYHRTFELDPDAVPKARMSYNRMRFVMAPMLDQQYGGAEVPLTAAMNDLATRLATEFADRPGGWFVGGPTAAWLQGVAIRPPEIDLGTDGPGATRIASALSEYLIEPLATTAWRGLGTVRGARAYVGTLRSGVRVRWGIGEGHLSADTPEFLRGPEHVATRVVPTSGPPVRVSRLEYALVAAARSRDGSGEAAIAGAIRAAGADPSLLDRLLEDSGLSPLEQDRLRLAVTHGPA